MHQNNSKKSIIDSVHPLWWVLLVQFAALLLVKFSATIWVDWLIGLSYVQGFLLLQVGLSVLLSWLMGLPRWWLWVQAVLPLGLYWGATQTLVDPLWFALGALLLMLVFSAVLKDRVPLYLTNDTTHQALVELVQTYQVRSVLDLGSGLGGVVRALARAGIDAKGIEYSPVLALISNAWCRWRGDGQVSRGDMWQTDLSQVDMVYVFLSPVPMTRLWQKACAEMKPGGLLVSNSFPIEDVEPLEVWELSDGRQTQLFIYQIP
jgi:hypothetical protein